MVKHLLFVNLNVHIRWDKGCSHGIAFLVPVAKKRGYTVSCITLNEKISAQDFKAQVSARSPSIVAFSSTSHHMAYLAFYSNAIQDQKNILQIAGGLGPTLDKEWLFAHSGVKGICSGEGETPLSELLDALDSGGDIYKTRGFSWRDKGSIIENPAPAFVNDLSLLAPPDYSIYPREMVVQADSLTMLLGRGCPYDCFFCCNNAKRKLYPDGRGYFRLPPVPHAIALIKKMLKDYPQAKNIYFFDDLLAVHKEWFAEFAASYSAEIAVAYRLNLRVENASREIVALLAKSGCTTATIGVETGNEQFRSSILNKKFTNAMLSECVRLLKNAGIEIHTMNMIGLPQETRSLMAQTLDINKKIAPDGGRCFYFYPYKGTALYEFCKEKKLLLHENYSLEQDNFSDRLAVKMNWADRCWCRHYYQAIGNYLNWRSSRAAIKKLTAGIKNKPARFFIAAYYSLSFNVIMHPLLHRLARFLSTITGLRRLRRRILKSKS